MSSLRLSAFDEEDLQIISAHLQDALLRVGDLAYLSSQHRFALVANRFMGQGETGQRRPCGVQFSHVRSVKSSRIRLAAKEAVLSVLAVRFTAADLAPEGAIELIFSGGGVISLAVECIEVSLEDLAPGRTTDHVPRHDLDDLS